MKDRRRYKDIVEDLNKMSELYHELSVKHSVKTRRGEGMSDGNYCRFCGAPPLVDRIAEQDAEIAALKAELSSSKQSRDREIMAYDRLNNAFIDLNLECDKLKAELARASEALLREWREKGSFSHGLTVANEIAQEKYKREIAQER